LNDGNRNDEQLRVPAILAGLLHDGEVVGEKVRIDSGAALRSGFGERRFRLLPEGFDIDFGIQQADVLPCAFSADDFTQHVPAVVVDGKHHAGGETGLGIEIDQPLLRLFFDAFEEPDHERTLVVVEADLALEEFAVSECLKFHRCLRRVEVNHFRYSVRRNRHAPATAPKIIFWKVSFLQTVKRLPEKKRKKHQPESFGKITPATGLRKSVV